MHSRSRLLLLALLVGAGTLALGWDASAQEPVTSRLKLSIGGYIKPEFIYRTSAGAPAYVGSIPGSQNFGFTAVAQKGTIAAQNGLFVAAANESRFNFTLNAPDWRGLKSMGFIEMDFDGDTVSTLERYCQSNAVIATSPCAGTQNAGGPAGSINNGAFRIRHAFFQLSGEGLGGQWKMLFGQTWSVFGMVPFYSGSSVSFGGASIFGGRGPQLRLTHTFSLFRDFSVESAIAASRDSTNFNEVPSGDIYTRLIYAGWQGWQGGTRTPLNAGISARVQRQKALTEFQPINSGAVNSGAGPGQKTLSNVAWGLTGGIFLPILPGRSATDRTWGLSVVSEGGYGEGVQGEAIPGTNPLPGAVTLGANNIADPGAVYFHPGKCSFFNVVPGTSPTLLSAAATCGGGPQETELSMIQSPWASYNVQFYLPYGFWLSGGQKWIWFTNSDNAVAQTCITLPNGACGALITPVNQGRFNSATGALLNNTSSLFGGRDAVIKRQTYSYVSAFYDMTPNIRWGFEWGMHGTNRKDSDQDNQSHRWQFAGYFFF